MVNFRKSRKSSLTSSTCSADETMSTEDSEDYEMSFYERLHTDDLTSQLAGNENGYVFYPDILDIITAR